MRASLFLVFFVLFGCSESSNKTFLQKWMSDTGKIKVLSTIAQIGDLAQEIGGDRIDHWILIQGSLDPHSYELVKGDGEKLSRADIIFYHGLGLEHAANLAHSLQTNSKSIAIGDTIARNKPDQILRRGGAIDPHIWMDIALWKDAIDPIVETLSSKDPEHASEYAARGNLLKAQMEASHERIVEEMRQVPSEKRYLVTSHDAFHYFTRSYLAEPGETCWSERVSAPEGLAPDAQLSSADIQRVVAYVKKHRIHILFPESNLNRDPLKKVLKSINIPLELCNEPLYGDCMEDQKMHYLDMMHHNARILSRYLLQAGRAN